MTEEILNFIIEMLNWKGMGMDKDMEIHKRVMTGFLAALLLIAACAGLSQAVIRGLAYDEKAAVIKVNSSVNVRTGAGTGNGVLTAASGGGIQLTNGKEVTIINEASASDGSLWYEIRFTYSDGAEYTGFVRSDYVSITQTDDAFEAYLNEQGFPESYKPALRTLHASYPNWVFKAYHTNLDWTASVEAESVLGRNLVNNYTSPSSWKSVQNGAYDWENSTWVTFDSGGWVMASEEIIEYYMDPRNFLTDTAIFEFLIQSYDSNTQNQEGLANIVAGTFLANSITDTDGAAYSYSDLLIRAAEDSGVSPYVLAAAILQEVGNSGGSAVSGTVSGYEGLFNYFNIGAYRTTTQSAVERGLWYAGGSGSGATSYQRPWNSHLKAVVGGAIWYGAQYVSVGQNTIYLKKFNVQGSNPYQHQYMSNVGAAYEEAVKLSKAYNGDSRQTALEFSIPVYENMPDTQCQRPTGNGSPNYLLSDLYVENYDLTPVFDRYTTEYSVIVEENVDSVTIGAAAYDSTATISGTGTVSLNVGMNSFEITVRAQNGTEKTYNLNIARQGEGTETPPSETVGGGDTSTSSNYRFDDSAMVITNISPSTSAQAFIDNISVENGSVRLLNSDGSEETNMAGTGDVAVIYDGNGQEVSRYQLLIYGDVNGDGKVSSVDLLQIQKHILKVQELGSVYLTACDANHDGKVASTDLLVVQKYVLGRGDIVQQ